MRHNYTVSILFILLTGSCNIFSKTSYQNVSYIYNSNNFHKTPEYLIFHNSDSISSLYFKVNSLNLLYVNIGISEKYESKFKIKIEIYDSYQSKNIIDSFSRHYSDTSNAFLNKEMIYRVNFPIKNNNYVLKVIFSDDNLHLNSTSYINIYKKSKLNSQNFLLLNKDSVPLFKTILPKSQFFRIFYNDTIVKRLYVSCFFKEFPIAGPPFSQPKEKLFVLKADSNFIVDISKGYSSFINLNKRGIYFFRKDTTLNEGISLFHFYDDFPKITTPLQMLYPTRYISSKKEFNEIILSKDKKLGIEAFWLQTAGNSEKAAEMIKKYYNLVQEANLFFSSYQEGWKTDRGIIYIVYGPPGIVNKTDNLETWIYGEENNRLSTRFYFYKVTNRFTDNDYSLNKSETYRDSWYIAMSNWRK